MITANFNAYNTYVVDSLYQWDLNQVLRVNGLNLAVVPEVHFSNANLDRAIVRQSTMSNQVVAVDIPNSLLQDPLPIYAYIGIYEGETFKVVEKIFIPVIPRKRPEDYQIQDSDEELYSFKALENAIENMVTKAEANVIDARIDNIVAQNNDTKGNSELVDIRIGYDGKTYPSSGAATRNQNEDIVNMLTRSGLYSEIVLSGVTKDNTYITKIDGVATEGIHSNRSAIVYDISIYAGKLVQISTVANSNTMYLWGFADADNKVLEIVNGYLVYKGVVSIPEDATTLFVNYAITEAETNSVMVKVIEVIELTESFDKVVSELENTNSKIDTLAQSGTLQIYLTWEMGGISTTGEIYTPDDIRIRTKEYYKSNFSAIRYIVPEGYRMLAVFYTYAEGEYTYARHRGYVTGSGEFTINEGEYIRFVLRGVEEMTFTGDEYKLLTLYHDSESFVTREGVEEILREYTPWNVPDYWMDTLSAKEQEIKNIIFDGVSADNDIAVFFTVADPHYPDNTEVSTVLMRYLGEKCGIGLTVCLGDLIADSPNSRDDGLERIQNGMTQLNSMSDRMILTQGNHDTNVQILDSNGQFSASRIIYDKEWILHTSNKLLGLNKIVFDDLGKAFYYDDDIQKIRFISLDSFEGKTYEITDDILVSLNLGRMTDRQVTWLKTVALQNIPSGYSVITFSHLAFYTPYVSNGSEFVSLTAGAMGDGVKVKTAIEEFIGNGGIYIGHFAGHLHHDFISAKDGLISVHSLNDGVHWRSADYFGEGFEFVGDAPLKVAGTVNECAFDVVIVNKTTRHVDLIRVGAGYNREFEY